MKQEAAAAVPAGMVDVTRAAPAAPIVSEKTFDTPAKAPPATPAALNKISQAIEGTPAKPATEPAQSEAAPSESPPETETPDKLAQATEAARKARKGAKKNRELVAEKTRLEQTSSYQASQINQLQQQLQEVTGYMQQLQADPLGAMRAFGVTPEEISKRVMQDGSPEGRIAQLQGELEAQRRQLQAMLQKEQAEQAQVHAAKVENGFKQESQNAKKYPNLQSIHPDFILARAKELIDDLKRRNVDYRQFNNHHILDYLNDQYASKPAPKAEPAATSDKTEAVTSRRPNTITNRMQTATLAVPPDFSSMSDRAQKKWMAEQVQSMMTRKGS